VYASHPPSPTTAQHSLPGGALPPYRGRSFTGRIASASPDAPELKIFLHSRSAAFGAPSSFADVPANGNVYPPYLTFVLTDPNREVR
jgi:hypothetical protein